MNEHKDLRPELRQQAGEILRRLSPSEREALLIKGWMSHDARWFMAVAREHGMEVFSCAEEADLQSVGIAHGKCIDDGLIGRLFGVEVTHTKDPAQRQACGCVQSKDIGMYDTCLFGCQYCYATRSFDLAREHYLRHDPATPALLPD